MGIKQKLVNVYVDKVKGSGTLPEVQSTSKSVAHDDWNTVVSTFVKEDGSFDYAGLKADTVVLDRYLDQLQAHHPNDEHWSPEAQMAYWINAYNAFTVKLVLEHYPITSIKTIKGPEGGPWKRKFITIEGAPYSLDDIEHLILRKSNEPRIHFAINCASGSCPAVRPEAYTADALEGQLEEQTAAFINNENHNRIDDNGEVELSKIFSWYQIDFGGAEKVKSFSNQYTDKNIAEDTTLRYQEYDWSLNEGKEKPTEG